VMFSWLASWLKFGSSHGTNGYALSHQIVADGSRMFGSLELPVLWDTLRTHAEKLPGVRVTGFVGNGVEVWIEFAYRGYAFTVNNAVEGEYWFFVEDPGCPDEVLVEVLGHFRRWWRGG
jgi:hypothetical protein